MVIENILIDFLSADYYGGNKTESHIKKVSPYLSINQSINCLINGSIDEDEEYRFMPMECMITPSKKVQNRKCYILPGEQKYIFQWIYMDIVINGKFKIDDIFNFPTKLPSQYNKEVYEIICAIRNYPNSKEYLCDRLSQCYKLVKILLEIAKPKKILDEEILNTIVYIKEHYNEKLTTKVLAENANMSISHFHRCFKRQMGKSPIDYINDYRLSISTIHLEQSNKTINDIASLLGFNEQYYFTKLFARKFGVTPSKYRKTVFLGIDKNT